MRAIDQQNELEDLGKKKRNIYADLSLYFVIAIVVTFLLSPYVRYITFLDPFLLLFAFIFSIIGIVKYKIDPSVGGIAISIIVLVLSVSAIGFLVYGLLNFGLM